jgi:hypothetical protein
LPLKMLVDVIIDLNGLPFKMLVDFRQLCTLLDEQE